MGRSCATNWGVPDKDRTPKHDAPQGPIGQTVQLVKDYARQETLGPLKGAGRWIAFGIVGAVLIGLGTAFLALGLLRMVQTEWPGTFQGAGPPLPLSVRTDLQPARGAALPWRASTSSP